MRRSRSLVRPTRLGAGWRSSRLQLRRRAARAALQYPPARHFEKPQGKRLARFLLMSIGAGIFATLVLTPTYGDMQEDKKVATYIGLVLAVLVSATVVTLATRAIETRTVHWTVLAAVSCAVSTLVVPWIFCITLAVPAYVGMPLLMFSFWTSLSAIGFMVAVKVRLLTARSLTTLVVGGSVGLAGFALMVTQFGTSAGGYEAVIPFKAEQGAELETNWLANGDISMNLRYDDGNLQKAYFEKGFLRVTRPAYFRYVEYAVTYKGGVLPMVSGRSHPGEWRTYVDAMQSLTTMGLVKQTHSGIAGQFSV